MAAQITITLSAKGSVQTVKGPEAGDQVAARVRDLIDELIVKAEHSGKPLYVHVSVA